MLVVDCRENNQAQHACAGPQRAVTEDAIRAIMVKSSRAQRRGLPISWLTTMP